MSWHLDSRVLGMVIAVAEEPTAARAAARLNVSPSALSHQMRNAEAALRVALFDRTGRRVRLTPLGEQLYASARRIMGGLEEAEGLLERSRRGDRPTIRLGGGPYPVHRLLLGRLDAAELAPIDWVTRTRAFPLAQAVATGELDLALVCARVAHRGVAATPLFEDDLVAAVPAAHPLARAPWLGPAGWVGISCITYSRVVEDGLEEELAFRPARSAPARFVLAETSEAILDLVAAGAGFGILSRWCVPTDRVGVDAIPLGARGARVRWSVLSREAERDDEVTALRDRIAHVLAERIDPCRS